LVGSIANVGVGLAWLSIDDTVWLNTRLQDLFNFGLGGTIKARSKLRQKSDDLGVRVAFDRYKY
jgi:hypothetical protein